MTKLPSFEHIQDPVACKLLELIGTMFESQQKMLEELQKALKESQKAFTKSQEQNQKLQDELAELKRLLFGKKSERMPSIQDEQKKKRKKLTEEEKAKRRQKAKEKRQKNKEKKKKQPKQKVHHTLDLDSLHCQQCQCDATDFSELGEGEVSYEYEYIPAQLLKKVHIREKKQCRCGQTIVTATVPQRVGEQSHHGPGLHAHVVVSKCLDSIPLYRQAKQFARAGVPLNPSTLGDLFHRAADVLRPLWQRMLEIVAQQKYVNADETRLPVQQKGKTKKAWIWTFLSGTIITFYFSCFRSGQTPREVLGQSTGFLQVDGHTGYNSVCTPENRTRAGCWSHARRKFFIALKSEPLARTALDWILELYQVEYEAAEQNILKTNKHLAMRKLKSIGVLEKMKKWLLKKRKLIPPKSAMGKAITYALNQWKTLIVFVDDPNILLDNNMSERSLRPIALGRKNFLFVGNDGAGQNLAILQSLVATCEASGVNPQSYLTDILIRIQSHPNSQIDELLPMNWASFMEKQALQAPASE